MFPTAWIPSANVLDNTLHSLCAALQTARYGLRQGEKHVLVSDFPSLTLPFLKGNLLQCFYQPTKWHKTWKIIQNPMASNGLQSPCESHDNLSTQLTSKNLLNVEEGADDNRIDRTPFNWGPKLPLSTTNQSCSVISPCVMTSELGGLTRAPSYRKQWEHFTQNCGTDNFSWFPTLDFEQTSHFTSHKALQNLGNGLLVDQKYLEMCIVLMNLTTFLAE